MPGRWGYFEPSRPIPARGGIRAQSRKGNFGENWWAQRWLAVLDSFDLASRLQRGRSYARRGQVLSINIEPGEVQAEVQGSRPDPYEVSIQVTPLTKVEWQKVGQELGRQAAYTAKLLAGEMPPDIEEAFNKAGVSLFPRALKDLKTHCSCPDWSNPCKHVAAVYYLLGEEFDRDPFLIFRLRGLSRDELVDLLGGQRPAGKASPEEAVATLPSEPLTAALPHFWEGDPVPGTLFGEVRTPPVAAALPGRLGSFPFWRGEQPFLEAMEPAYIQASKSGMALFLGEAGQSGPSPSNHKPA